MRILIAEDDFTARCLLSELLLPLGQVDVAVDGEETVQAVRRAIADGRHYELICLDIKMPKMSGLDVLQKIREEESGHGLYPRAGAARIVMTTGESAPKAVMGAFKDQCDGYLVKPVEEAGLLKTLSDLGLYDSPA